MKNNNKTKNFVLLTVRVICLISNKLQYRNITQAMTSKEKVCLTWNDFKDNVTSTFLSLRKDNDFTDVTLACEDNEQIEAHKVVLAASSSFFQNVLKRNKHSHPLIYMKGMKYEDLLAILDFMYYGETNIHQENIDSFLGIAEDLGLSGLAGETNSYKEESTQKLSRTLTTLRKKSHCQSNALGPIKDNPGIYNTPQKNFSDLYIQHQEPSSDTLNQHQDDILENKLGLAEENPHVVKVETSENLNGTVNSMISKIGSAWTCNSCGKVANDKSNLMKHVKNKHNAGLEYSCTRCNKMYRLVNSVYN